MIKLRRLRRMRLEWGRRRMHIGYWWERQKEKRSPGKPRLRSVDNIKVDLREI
jgi:hypothetical protein